MDDAISRAVTASHVEPIDLLRTMVEALVNQHVLERKKVPPNRLLATPIDHLIHTLSQERAHNDDFAQAHRIDDDKVSNEDAVTGMIAAQKAHRQATLIEMLLTAKTEAEAEAGMLEADEDDDDDRPRMRLVRD